LIFVLASAALPAFNAGPLHRVSAVICACVGVAASWIGGWLAAASLERRIRPEVGFSTLLRGMLARMLVIFPHALLTGVAAWWLPSDPSRDDAWMFALVLALLIVSICGAGLVPARLLGLVL
jgi:hypothetical protein